MTMRPSPITTRLGAGAGWRPQIDGALAQVETLGFIEVIAESIGAGALPDGVVAARERGLQVVPHTREALEILCENVAIAQEALPVPLALEHVAALVQWPSPEMDEATFVRELIERTGALLLLDLSNPYANALNHGYEALEALARFPLERIAYVHVGGGVLRDGVYHDTHSHPVVPGVLHLVEELCAIADPPGVMLEHDDDFPPASELIAELKAIAAAVRRGGERRACA